jgi:hypothetical protein
MTTSLPMAMDRILVRIATLHRRYRVREHRLYRLAVMDQAIQFRCVALRKTIMPLRLRTFSHHLLLGRPTTGPDGGPFLHPLNLPLPIIVATTAKFPDPSNSPHPSRLMFPVNGSTKISFFNHQLKTYLVPLILPLHFSLRISAELFLHPGL